MLAVYEYFVITLMNEHVKVLNCSDSVQKNMYITWVGSDFLL